MDAKKRLTTLFAIALIALIALVGLFGASTDTAEASSGSIKTTDTNCVVVNKNHYFNVGEQVKISGTKFAPGEYNWTVVGLPGGASSHPDILVGNGTYTVSESGEFCFLVHTVQSGEWGEFKVDFGGKHDNYRVHESEATETPTPKPTETPSPTPITPTPGACTIENLTLTVSVKEIEDQPTRARVWASATWNDGPSSVTIDFFGQGTREYNRGDDPIGWDVDRLTEPYDLTLTVTAVENEQVCATDSATVTIPALASTPTPTPPPTETPSPTPVAICNKSDFSAEIHDNDTATFTNVGPTSCWAVFAAYDTNGFANLNVPDAFQTLLDYSYELVGPYQSVTLSVSYDSTVHCEIQEDAMVVAASEEIPGVVPDPLTAENQGTQYAALKDAITKQWPCEPPPQVCSEETTETIPENERGEWQLIGGQLRRPLTRDVNTGDICSFEYREVQPKLKSVRAGAFCDSNGNQVLDLSDTPLAGVELWFGVSGLSYPIHQDRTSGEGWTSYAVGENLSAVTSLEIMDTPYDRLNEVVYEVPLDGTEPFEIELPRQMMSAYDKVQIAVLLDCGTDKEEPEEVPCPECPEYLCEVEAFADDDEQLVITYPYYGPMGEDLHRIIVRGADLAESTPAAEGYRVADALTLKQRDELLATLQEDVVISYEGSQCSTCLAEWGLRLVGEGADHLQVFVGFGSTAYDIAITLMANDDSLNYEQAMSVGQDAINTLYATDKSDGTTFIWYTIPDEPSASTDTYVVQQGDTLWGIATTHGVTVQQLVDANGISNPNVIFAGQVLVIPAAP